MQREIRSIVVCLILLLASSWAFAEENYPVPDEEFVYCTVCHGIQLMGNPIIQAPRLSNREPWYIERQLEAFKKGWRGTHTDDYYGMEMQPMAAALTTAQIGEVTEFVSQTRSPDPAPSVSGDNENGARLYVTCSACHGADAKGNEALGGPSLVATNDWYQVTQLKNFKAGIRGMHDEDTYGTQMRAAAALLPDDQAILDVVSYIHSLEND